jgi:hypothetical protein
VRLADGQQHTAGQATFAGAAIKRLRDRRNRAIQIRIGQHDDEVLGATESLHTLAGGRGTLIHRARNGRGSDEGHGTNARVITDGLGDGAAAVDEIHNAGRQVAALEQLKDSLHRQRHLLRRLQHERIAADDRKRQEPQRHHGREVERRNRRRHANRLPHDLAVEIRRDVLETVPHQHRRRAARDFDAFDPRRTLPRDSSRVLPCSVVTRRANSSR